MGRRGAPSKGIGYRIAERFVDAGANVIVVSPTARRPSLSRRPPCASPRGRGGASTSCPTSRPDRCGACWERARRGRRAPRRLRRQLRPAGNAVPRPFEWQRTLKISTSPARSSRASSPPRMLGWIPEPGGARDSSIPSAPPRPRVGDQAGDSSFRLPPRSWHRPGCVDAVARSHGDAGWPQGQLEVYASDGVGAARPGRHAADDEAALYLCSPRPAGSSPAPDLIVDGGESLW